MSEPEDYSDVSPDRSHSQDPAEGAEEPGEVHPSLPHAQAPTEGEEED